MRWSATLFAIPVLLQCAPCAAQKRLDRFPQFRGLSGLACGGYGVDAEGRESLTGPVALSTPAAHVLGRGRFKLQYSSISADRGLISRSTHNNQTVIATYGISVGRVNIQASDMALSSRWDQAFNVQAQWIPDAGARVAFSAGIQDIIGTGGSAGEGLEGDDRSSRSLFGTATYRFGPESSPWHLSAGVGTRRFRYGFASASVNVARPVRLWAEHDGLGVNLGVLVTGTTGDRRPVEATGLIAIVAGRYLTTGVGIGF